MSDQSTLYTVASHLRKGAGCQTELAKAICRRNLKSKVRTIFIGSMVPTLKKEIHNCDWSFQQKAFGLNRKGDKLSSN